MNKKINPLTPASYVAPSIEVYELEETCVTQAQVSGATSEEVTDERPFG